MDTASVENAFWPSAEFIWSDNDSKATLLVDGGLPFALGETPQFQFGLTTSAKDLQGNALASALDMSITLAPVRRQQLFMTWMRHSYGGGESYSFFVVGDLGDSSPIHSGGSFDTSELPQGSITTIRSATLIGTVHLTIGPSSGNLVLVAEHYEHDRDATKLHDSSRVVQAMGSLSFGSIEPQTGDTVELDVTDAFDAFWTDSTRTTTGFSFRMRPQYVIDNSTEDSIRFKRWNAIDQGGPPPASEFTNEGFRLVVDYL